MSEVNPVEYESLLEEVENDPVAARELAAAELSMQTLSILNVALARSGLTQRDLAQKIGVTESAVSQTLFGDGNLKIYTLARYLKALGFEASLELLSDDVMVSSQTPSTRRTKVVVGFRAADVSVSPGVAFDFFEGSNVFNGALSTNVANGESQQGVEFGSEKIESSGEVPNTVQSTSVADFSLAA
jgi:transcriptional regulator with XRE-family HTH domain